MLRHRMAVWFVVCAGAMLAIDRVVFGSFDLHRLPRVVLVASAITAAGAFGERRRSRRSRVAAR